MKYDEGTIASLNKYYYYGILDKDDNTNYKTVVFWRWRKREPRDNYLKRQFKVSLPGKEYAGTIQELYKFNYGPRPGVTYNLETGLITGRKKPMLNTASLLQRLNMHVTNTNRSLQDRLSDSTPSTMSVDERSDSSDKDFNRFPEVPDNLYHPHTVNSPAAWIRCNDELLIEEITPLHRSQSPVHLSDPYFAPHEKPEVMFQCLLKDESVKITEARMRYWANCWDTTRTAKTLLTTAIEHGLRFYLALPPDRIRQFRPLIVDSLDKSSALFSYGVSFQEQPLSPMDNTITFCSSYLAKMNDLLRRPRARAFIAEGGQISWIAR
ncbi:uncharacterized protein LACBIDRAFT_329903 [Laccaria bicolor S238N-H82]|uniref:Predicted protein n=1 Tax=Laccaria bicolor (strain S238N-H82 / ATCC MYA-4686) TaxID=486041 RepID=B0DJK8_LACBS|nr:uncharacterized protein LACBIDRAFT_329903 [Laccaria bicolor S238N-H82]EDR05226.1 predicted protein [Laccaria bicolor S238N-H82]|eukprot:XP_001884191.1 predicted protein [Laccaria bicolor S238N-H82]